MAYRYFIYSRNQLEFKREREKKLGKTFKPGWVIVNGKKKNITEISLNGSIKFSDSIIVASGEEKDFKYVRPSS